MAGYAGTIASHLHSAASHSNSQRVYLKAKAPASKREIPALVRSPVDLVVFDGHGHLPARVGRLPIDPGRIRDEQGRGIVAPVFVLGACGGATEPFIQALRTCLDSPQTAFLGCAGDVEFTHAEIVFPQVVSLLADLGASPSPAIFYAGLTALLDELGDTACYWAARLLTPFTADRR